MKTTAGIVLLVCMVTASAPAETRIWTDIQGNSLEAEFVLLTGGKALLKKADGKEIQVSLNTLSAEDREYIQRRPPPRLELDVNLDVDRRNSGNGYRVQIQTESMSAKVTIKKNSASAYDAPLYSEIFLLGQHHRSDDIIVMERAESEVRFEGSGRSEYVYTSGTVSSRQHDGISDAGMDFKGYLAVVRDQDGTVIAMKASKSEYESFAESISAAQSGDALDRNFDVIENGEAGARQRRRFF